jgi:hypothetical protein
MRFASMLLALGCLLSTAGAQSHDQTIQSQTAPTPARVALERMSPAERANSSISVEFESSDSDAVALGRQVELLWNGGQHNEALAQLASLEARAGKVAIGNSWRKPVPTPATGLPVRSRTQTGLWGRDVRIGNRDSLAELSFEADDSSGHLFVALRSSGGYPHFSVCMSADSGATWDETFTWSGSPPTSVVGAMDGNHFYLVYNSPGDNAQQVRLRRFLCSDGRADVFQNNATWIVPCTLALGDTMKEVSLVSYAYLPTNRYLFMTILVSDGSVLWNYVFATGGGWHTTSTGITSGASHGLGSTANMDSDSSRVFFSFYDTSDTLRIYRYGIGGFRRCFSLLTGSGTPTTISAYGDTIICAYEDEVSSPHQVRCVTNFGDGDTWRMGTISDPHTAAQAPAVTTRRGGGFAAVYRHCAPTRELRFCRRAYNDPWSDPVSIADNEPYWSRPGIACLDTTGVFGVVYLSNTSPVVRGAYFARSDWRSGIEETPSAELRTTNRGPTVVRGVLFMAGARDEGQGTRDELLDVSGKKVMGLRSGANDLHALAAGVYFVRAVSRKLSAVSCSKVVVTR